MTINENEGIKLTKKEKLHYFSLISDLLGFGLCFWSVYNFEFKHVCYFIKLHERSTEKCIIIIIIVRVTIVNDFGYNENKKNFRDSAT